MNKHRKVRAGRSAPSRLDAGYGAVKPRRNPEDFERVRREVEDEVGERASGAG